MKALTVRLALLALAAPGFFAIPALAQDVTQKVGICDPTPYVHNCVKPNSDGSINVSGVFSATLSGFTPTAGATANLTNIVNTSQDVALPAGADIVVTNKGAIDLNFRMQAGAGTAVSTDQTLKAGAAVGLHVLTNTHLSAIAPTGTGTGATAAQLNIQGGAGLATGYGGGGSSGGGGGGAVTIAGGADVTEGTIGDTQATGTVVGYLKSIWTGLFGTAGTPSTSVVSVQGVGSGTPIPVSSGVADGASSTGPSQSPISCNSLTAPPTAYSTATYHSPVCDSYGNSVVQPYSLSGGLVSGVITTAMTGTTSTLLVAAPGSGLRNYITSISCNNTHATQGTLIDVQDGSGGTVLKILAAAPAYGGESDALTAPIRQPTANTALYVVNETTGASTKCSANGYKAP